MKLVSYIVTLSLIFTGCAVQENNRVVDPLTVDSHLTPYHGTKHKIVVGNFTNRSTYRQGLFTDGEDRLGDQAKTVLKTHLQQSNRFSLFDRDNLNDLAQEAAYNQQQQSIQGANFAIVGSVTEFGRRNSGDKQLYGILGRGKQQLAYAKVLLNVVNVHTSEVIHSSQGAGEYTLSSREAVGFGSSTGYDSTLNGKVLDLAIREAVSNLVSTLENGQWSLANTQ